MKKFGSANVAHSRIMLLLLPISLPSLVIHRIHVFVKTCIATAESTANCSIYDADQSLKLLKSLWFLMCLQQTTINLFVSLEFQLVQTLLLGIHLEYGTILENMVYDKPEIFLTVISNPPAKRGDCDSYEEQSFSFGNREYSSLIKGTSTGKAR